MEGLMLWLVSIEVALCLLVAILACVCGCRKTVPKNDLLGLAGMVKLTNPDEPYSQNGQWSSTTFSPSQAPDLNSNKRSSTTANRSLPDLPVDHVHPRNPDGSVISESQEGGGDTGSELYATVEENARPGSSQFRSKKLVPRELSSESKDESDDALGGATPGCAPGGSEDDGFSTYARLRKEHPYDKVRKSEHPYAQVRAPSSRDPDADEPLFDRSDNCDPVPPPRTRKSLSHCSLTPPQSAISAGAKNNDCPPHSPGSRSLHSPGSRSGSSIPDIPAATAIAGRISANQELPYMTPPLNLSQNQTGQHFSGDSQDSSKGYTSISVREPLANIRPQRPHDSHYATVSDDSDEMYAAIEEPSQVYTSGSETYAQIQPLMFSTVPGVSARSRSPELTNSEESNNGVQNLGPVGMLGILAPQPPSVDSLKHVAQAHSRQASSSSAASSVANLGSPKPEKRPANSPLPPPPANLASPEGGCSLEDMYAKVIKKKRGSSEETDQRSQDTDSPRSQPSSPQRRYSTPQPIELSASSDPGYETVSVTELKVQEELRDPHFGYETVNRAPLSDTDPNYEELHLQGQDAGYAHIGISSEGSEPSYARIARNQTTSISNNRLELEPDYASISRGKKGKTNGNVANDQDDPGYEKLKLQKKNLPEDDSDQDNPGYERVNAPNSRKPRSLGSASDPGYEQVRLTTSDHQAARDQNYEGIVMNQCDPNYETVLNEEPSYESVRYHNESVVTRDSCKQTDGDEGVTNPLLGNKEKSIVR